MTVGSRSSVLSIGLIGYGALGSALADLVARPENAILEIRAVLELGGVDRPEPVDDIDALLQRCDVVVEAAGPAALHSYARPILASDRTLVAASVGAFLQDDLRALLTDNRPGGQLILSTGALGGIELIRASSLADPAATVTLKSRKRPASLVQPWMDRGLTRQLEELGPEDDAVPVFAGKAPEAARLFPANLNVAGALAIAVGDPARVTVELIADPRAELTTHRIELESVLGRAAFVVENRPLKKNPSTSGVVPWAVLRCLRELATAGDTYRFA